MNRNLIKLQRAKEFNFRPNRIAILRLVKTKNYLAIRPFYLAHVFHCFPMFIFVEIVLKMDWRFIVIVNVWLVASKSIGLFAQLN